jgi:multimeric flavodoxin WrbA
MKVLLVNGSPNEKGCTYAALNEIVKILEEEKIETEIFNIGKKSMQGCIACGKCRELKKCVFDDDVNVFIEKAKLTDGFIFGSPVYYSAPNGTLISFMNRLFFAGNKYLAYKPAAAVVSARRAGTTSAFEQLNKYFAISYMPQVPSQYWNMVHGSKPEDVLKDLEGMQIMRTLARNMSWLLKSIEAGKKLKIELPKIEDIRYQTNFIR